MTLYIRSMCCSALDMKVMQELVAELSEEEVLRHSRVSSAEADSAITEPIIQLTVETRKACESWHRKVDTNWRLYAEAESSDFSCAWGSSMNSVLRRAQDMSHEFRFIGSVKVKQKSSDSSQVSFSSPSRL